MMENAKEPVNPDKVKHMSVEQECQLRGSGNSEFLIQTLKRAGELGILDSFEQQNSRVVQRIIQHLNQIVGYKAYETAI